LTGVAIATVVFVLLISPFVIAISKAKGRFTTGDAAILNFAYYLRGAAPYNWQGENDTGTPVHSSRKVFDSPPVYEFATPISGTYPSWYDPSYWHEGIKPRFDLKKQIKTIIINLSILGRQLLNPLMLGVLASLIILLGSTDDKRKTLHNLFDGWFLIFIGLAVTAAYLLVHLEPRYLAPFLVSLLMGLFFGVRLPDSKTARRLVSSATLAVFLFFAVAVFPPSLRGAYSGLNDALKGRDAEKNFYWRVADGATQMGLREGDKISCVGASVTHSKWARLAKVQIISEVYSPNWDYLPQNTDEEVFWASDPAVKEQVMQVFAKTGAKAVVTLDPQANMENWQPIGETGYYIRFLY
jgi:hypothetical protein